MIIEETHTRISKATTENVLAAKNGSSFQLGDLIDRGCFNYRWPVTEHYLDLHPHYHWAKQTRKDREKGVFVPAPGSHVGTCQTFSCVKDNMFYQVLRIDEGSDSDMSFPPDSQIVLTIGGQMYFQSHLHEFIENKYTVMDISEVEANHAGYTTTTVRYWDSGGRGLEAKLYQLIDGEYQPLLMSKLEDRNNNQPGKEIMLTSYHAVSKLAKVHNLPRPYNMPKAPRSATFVAAIRVFEGDIGGASFWPQPPNSKSLYDYIGVNPMSVAATGAMWGNIYTKFRTEPVLELTEYDLIGRSLEKILQVDIVPASFDDDDEDDESESPRKRYETLMSNLFTSAGAGISLKSLL